MPTEEEIKKAQALIQVKENENALSFLNAYKKLCLLHGYRMSPKVTITEKGFISEVQVIKVK